MDQDKIGKLIAKLRKEKGLTQRELGDKVGVGFKAVSKWERGITCPDISIINELSKILGITSDELLSGELNENKPSTNTNKTDINKFNKKLLFIIPIVLIILVTFIIIKVFNNKTHVYNLFALNSDYSVKGKIIFTSDEISISINDINFNDSEFYQIVIKNYKYQISSNNQNIMSYGYIDDMELISSNMTIKEFSKKFTINYSNLIEISRKDITQNNIILTITFLDIKDNLITKDIAIGLEKASNRGLY